MKHDIMKLHDQNTVLQGMVIKIDITEFQDAVLKSENTLEIHSFAELQGADVIALGKRMMGSRFC